LLSLVPKLDDVRKDLVGEAPPAEPPKPSVEPVQPGPPDAGPRHHGRRARPTPTE